MHHDSALPDLNSLGTGMQVHAFVQVNAMSKLDMVCKPQADPALDRSQAVHVQDEAINDATQAHADDRGDPAKQQEQRLFEDISEERRCLAVKIKANAG